MGEYRWSGTVYGCDDVYDKTKNWIDPAIAILNFFIMGKNFPEMTEKKIYMPRCQLHSIALQDEELGQGCSA